MLAALVQEGRTCAPASQTPSVSPTAPSTTCPAACGTGEKLGASSLLHCCLWLASAHARALATRCVSRGRNPWGEGAEGQRTIPLYPPPRNPPMLVCRTCDIDNTSSFYAITATMGGLLLLMLGVYFLLMHCVRQELARLPFGKFRLANLAVRLQVGAALCCAGARRQRQAGAASYLDWLVG